ncbi:hypothetical protein CRN80_17020 [Pseudomonas sp. FDAARGOS_380]|nr:hypothetical protein CRN80_17020 [Pseudomonas sp. FDAARGOS_380]
MGQMGVLLVFERGRTALAVLPPIDMQKSSMRDGTVQGWPFMRRSDFWVLKNNFRFRKWWCIHPLHKKLNENNTLTKSLD